MELFSLIELRYQQIQLAGSSLMYRDKRQLYLFLSRYSSEIVRKGQLTTH